MKIAVTYETGLVFQPFGHSRQFKIYEDADGKILSGTVVAAGGSGHGALAGFLKALGVDALICGGIGGGARAALAEAGIDLYPGVVGLADQQAAALAEGRLMFDPNTVCAHHHEESGHNCGGHDGHSCSDHECGGHCNS